MRTILNILAVQLGPHDRSHPRGIQASKWLASGSHGEGRHVEGRNKARVMDLFWCTKWGSWRSTLRHDRTYRSSWVLLWKENEIERERERIKIEKR